MFGTCVPALSAGRGLPLWRRMSLVLFACFAGLSRQPASMLEVEIPGWE